MIRSFRDALRGLAFAVMTQRNVRVHLLAALLVGAMGLWLGLTRTEWALLALTISLVVGAEMFNTALEALADAASPAFHPLVASAKDVAAGAVLVCAAGSAVVGILVLGPPLIGHMAR